MRLLDKVFHMPHEHTHAPSGAPSPRLPRELHFAALTCPQQTTRGPPIGINYFPYKRQPKRLRFTPPTRSEVFPRSLATVTPTLMKPSRILITLRTTALATIVAATTLLPGCSSTKENSTDIPPASRQSQWNPESWKPHSTFKRPHYTEAERLRNRQAQLDKYVQLGATPKDLSVVRWVNAIEFAEIKANELNKYGIKAIVDETGGLSYIPGIPESQQELLNQINYDLYSQYPIDPIYTTDFTEEQLGMLWDYWSEYYIPCMNAQGITLEQSPVSRETFISTFLLPNSERWWPIHAGQSLAPETRSKISRICPPFPAPKYLYGE